MELQRLLLLIIVTSVETLIVLQKREPIFHFIHLSCLIIFLTLKSCFFSNPTQVYLVDFSCLKPPSSCIVPFSKFLGNASKFESFDKESLAFMAKVLASSGHGQETYLPPALHHIPPLSHHQESIEEVHMVLFPIMDDLLAKTNLSPQEIDILIVNCSGFCPSPSFASIVINKYSMRSNVKSYSLSGMGCSASALAIDLAKNLLKVHKNSYAVVLSTEILSTGWYAGHEQPKLILNCVFRMGSAAILLTNKKQEKMNSKYELFLTLRTQKAFDDRAYLSTIREEDSNGKLGVTIKRDILEVAGELLRWNVMVLGSSILPFLEKFRYGVSVIRKRYIDKSTEIYVPNFKTVIEHFCLPTSGRQLVSELAKGLKLGDREMEAALMTLHRFGNQSSSSLWYELAYLEAKQRVKKGDRVWQLGMGTGPKCTSLVWKCIRPMDEDESKKGPWADSIHQYPLAAVDR
ncbi:3-ketoacyl-CoA synthase 5-like [Pyrus communis]|uniref:3-ketoacyl-CoA synthase 5-like n=1 Tax=Pyrus communis TaxID=23211 RepID=UPI0035C22A3E